MPPTSSDRRTPTPTPVGLARPAKRNTYSLRSFSNTDGREHHTITMPRRGPNRELARETIMKLLHRSSRLQHRVAFVITYLDGRQYTLGSKGGYNPERALTQCRIEQDDPISWLADQLHDQHPNQHVSAIIGVDLTTWPTTN